jgi:hypothetical protein
MNDNKDRHTARRPQLQNRAMLSLVTDWSDKVRVRGGRCL